MSTFQGNIDGHIAIPGTYTTAGGTTNFNFGLQPGPKKSDRPHKPFSTVPFAPDVDFVDRPDIIAWVRKKCARPGARAALVGLGGVGKSQIAIQYAHQVQDAAPDTYIFWVYASTRVRFEEAYRGIANKLQLLDNQDPNVDVLRLVSDWLSDETNGRWTMVIDNVDDVETFFPLPRRGQDRAAEGPSIPLADYLPQTRNGSILITSRSRDAAARLAGGYHNIKDVTAMDESQGLELLHNKLSIASADQSAAVELVRILDHMPLAITQAAAYINRRARMTITRFIREFRMNDERRESLLNCDAGDLRRDRTAANSVVTTWQMSFERIQQERPSAADLLSLMSFFNPQEIPEKTLRSYYRTTVCAETEDDQDKADDLFDEDLDILYAYSLVSILPEKSAYEMHALVQFCTRIWLSSINEVERWRCHFMQLLAHEFPNGEYETWTECQRLLPHIEPWFNREPECEETAKAWAQILTCAVWYFSRKGSYEIAQTIAENALATRERILGPNESKTLTSMGALAEALWGCGKPSEAEKLNRRVLAAREKELGEHHQSTLRMMGNLAVQLYDLGKHDEAEKLNRRALAIMEEKLGEYHTDTLWVVGSLAMVLQSQGKYTEAEKLSRRAMKGREKVLGEKHPFTLLAVWGLANGLLRMERYEEAEPLYQRAYNGLVQALGSQHPWTVRCDTAHSMLKERKGKSRLC